MNNGALIIRAGIGNTLLGFEVVHSYICHPSSELTAVLKMVDSQGFTLHHSTEAHDWFIFTNGRMMVEIRVMVFGQEMKGFE